MRERQEDYVRWEKKYRGLCRNEYYVGTPATRTVSEVYSETTFRLEPAKIKVVGALFLSMMHGRRRCKMLPCCSPVALQAFP